MFGIPTVTVVKTTLDATTASVTLTYVAPSAAWTPRHLLVRINTKCESGQPSNNIRFNGDTGTNYNRVHVQGSGSSPSAGISASSDKLHAGQNESGTNEFGATEILIPDALSTRSHKSTVALNGATEDSAQSIGGRWASTAAITSVTIFTSGVHYSIGSTFELCVVDESFQVNEQIITGSNAAFASVTEDGSNFPSDDGDLVVISNVRNASSGTAYNAYIGINGDLTSSNYEFQRVGGYNGGVFGSRGNSPSNGSVPGNAATAGMFGGGVHHIASYSDTVGHKILNSLTAETTNTNSNDMIVQRTLTRWASTAAVANFVYQPSDAGSWLVGSMLSTYRIPSTGTNYIQRQTMTGNTTTVTFSSIPQTYDHLELISYARGSRSNTTAPLYMTLNSDTTASNYDVQQLQANSGTVSSYTGTATTRIGVFPAASESSGQWGSATTTFYNYTKTDRHHAYLTAMGSSGYTIENFSHRWESTAALTQIVLTINGGDFIAGTTFELRGISADVTPAAGVLASINTIASADIAKVNELIITAVQSINSLAWVAAGGTAWTATTSISTSRDRRGTGGAGNNTDFVLMGGYDSAYRNYTDEWNGSSWASQSGMPGNYLNGGWYAGGRFGRTSNDAGSVGGYRYNYSATTKEYNGSSWSYTGNVGTGRQSNGATGESTNAAVTFGGAAGSDLSSTEEYNGSSWSSANALPYTSSAPGAMGSLNDALQMAGKNGGSNAQTCAEYDGTSWSTIASLNQAAGQDPQGFGLVSTTAHAVGTSGPAYAGSGADHDVYNGSTWSSATNQITTRTGGGGGGGDASGFIASGTNASGLTATCEEWT